MNRWILILLIMLCYTAQAADKSVSLIQLPDPTHKGFNDAVFLHAMKPIERIQFTVWLKLRQEHKLDELVRELYSPESKIYHQFLSQKQFDASFAPTDTTVNSIKTYLAKNKLTILSTAKSNFYLRVSGQIADIERVFHIKMNQYRFQGKKVYINNEAPFIDKQFANTIQEITGLNNIPIIKRFKTRPKPFKTNPPFAPIYGLDTQIKADLVDAHGTVIVPQMTFSGFVPGGHDGNGYTGQQLQHAYEVDQLISQGIDGTGQEIVILDDCLSPTLTEDVQAFSVANHLPTADIVIQAHTPNPPRTCTYSEQPRYEETLDVEAAHALAPYATIVLSLGDTATSADTFYQIITDTVNSNEGQVISISYNNDETFASVGSGVDNALKRAATMGSSVNGASGDFGDNSNNPSTGNTIAVLYPASSTYATAVGGTSLFVDNLGNYQMETGWGTEIFMSYSCSSSTVISGSSVCLAYQPNYANIGLDGDISGSTGGISVVFPAQATQQNAIQTLYAGGYGLVNSFVYSANPYTLFRAVPDVSMFANDYPGMEIYITVHETDPAPSLLGYGGTSLATPLFSSLLVLANQERAALGKSPVGLASTYLYNLPADALHPINNLYGIGNPIAGIANPTAFQLFEVQNDGSLYGIVYNLDTSLTLGPIWNDVAGVGSPIAPTFVQALAASP